MADVVSYSSKLTLSLLSPILITLNLIIVWKIWKKNSPDFKPVHIYQVNYFVTLALSTLNTMIVLLSKRKEDFGKICPKEIFRYFLSICIIYDVVILQLDRLIAVRYPYFYNEKMDVSMSLKIIAIGKFVSMSIAVIGCIIDPVFVYCPVLGRCSFVHSIYVYTVSYPILAAFILTVSVSIYVSTKVYKQISVQPVVQLPVINVLPAIDDTISAENEVQNVHIEEDTESLEEINIPSMMKEMTKKDKVRRKIVNRNNRVGPSTSKVFRGRKKQNMRVNQVTFHDLQVEAHKKFLKKTLKMNLLTLTILFISVPIQVVTIISENCNDSLGECDFFFKFWTVNPRIQSVAAILHPILFLFILDP